MGEGVDFYHAINPDVEGNKGTSTVELTEGDYTVSLISPLNRDGSAYELHGTSEEQQVALEAGGELSVDFVMTLIAAEDVTDETVQSIVSQTRLAVENGDETLKGDAGRSVLDRLVQNAAANPNASDETKDEAAKAEEEADVDGEPAASTPSAPARKAARVPPPRAEKAPAAAAPAAVRHPPTRTRGRTTPPRGRYGYPTW